MGDDRDPADAPEIKWSLPGTPGGNREKVRRIVGQGRLHGQDPIGARVRKVLDEYKVGKYYKLEIH